MGESVVRQRTSTYWLVVLMVVALLLGVTSTATAATTWKRVTPSARFVKYAKHAKKHGMQAWYPSRLPSGYKLSSMSLGDTANSGPYCDMVFKNGNKRIYMSQGTIVGADGESPPVLGRTRWGTQWADVIEGGTTLWLGRDTYGFANLYGPRVPSSQLRTIAKNMKKVR